MPFTTLELYYIRWEFDVGGDLEIADTGCWFHLDTDATDPVDQPIALASMCDQAEEAWQQFSNGDFSVDTTGRRVVAYYYGSQVENVVDRAEGPLAWNPSGGRLPIQCSVVLSTYGYDPATYTSERASKRGRMYLPTPGDGVLGTNPYMTTTAQNSILDGAQSMFDTLNEDIQINIGNEQGNLTPCVVSKTKQYATNISFLRVGRVIDTQRRRRNALTEAYVTGPVYG